MDDEEDYDEPHWTDDADPTGYITVEGEPMAYWMPDGRTLEEVADEVPF